MLAFVVRRLLLMLPSLLGITFVTFLFADLAPSDRAAIELSRLESQGELAQGTERESLLRAMRVRYGTHDAVTGEPLGLVQRYGNWMQGLASGDWGSRAPGQPAVGASIREALPATLLLGLASALLALAYGIPRGVALGMRAGNRVDRLAAAGSMAALAMPEFLLATVLLLAFGGAGLQWVPSTGWSPGRGVSPAGLVLPVLSLAIPLALVVTRFVREAVRRARTAPFAVALEGFGIEPAHVRQRMLHHASAPVATLVGGFVPMLVGGSIVVESVYAMEGLGRLAWSAAMGQDTAMVMALTLLVGTATLLGTTLSDALQRALDPRAGATS